MASWREKSNDVCAFGRCRQAPTLKPVAPIGGFCEFHDKRAVKVLEQHQYRNKAA